MLLEMNSILTCAILYMRTLHGGTYCTIYTYSLPCNENTEIECAMRMLMDDILVTINQVDLRRPT